MHFSLYPFIFSLLPLFLFLVFLLKWLSITARPPRKNPPPSPRKLPLIGNLHQMGPFPHRSLHSLSQAHGPLMLLHFAAAPVLIASSSSAARDIMKTHDLIFSNRPKSTICEKLMYATKDVAFSPYGEYWRQMKSICVLQMLSNKRVQSFRDIREEETALMIEKILNSGSDVVNLSELIVELTANVVCRAAFGLKYDGVGGRGGGARRGFKEDVFAAGTDTTSTALEWVMTELLKHTQAMKKLQAEVRVIAQSNQPVTEDDLDQMPYLKAVIKETLRLHPPSPILVPRESTKDVQVMGYDIAAGTRVVVNAWAIGRDPASWDEPEEFRPERFLNGHSIDFRGQDFELIPFGAGRRGCPGIQFAVAVDELAVANLVHKFDFALPDGVELDVSEDVGINVHKKLPLLLVATPWSC
ncbi:hypothetical protein RHGRI_034959 [Rhododendron griersonianum]|uniref:Uncharacterized protein n=1 Tax=Rhododendron griersonianum TaxID=479676 RepID=A0AAV6I612_9ERIC|nr:hypothetical protein RHGRI_034959 [Rhododendron griersonianum]